MEVFSFVQHFTAYTVQLSTATQALSCPRILCPALTERLFAFFLFIRPARPPLYHSLSYLAFHKAPLLVLFTPHLPERNPHQHSFAPTAFSRLFPCAVYAETTLAAPQIMRSVFLCSFPLNTVCQLLPYPLYKLCSICLLSPSTLYRRTPP